LQRHHYAAREARVRGESEKLARRVANGLACDAQNAPGSNTHEMVTGCNHVIFGVSPGCRGVTMRADG
jgi:hypothetical protein